MFLSNIITCQLDLCSNIERIVSLPLGHWLSAFSLVSLWGFLLFLFHVFFAKPRLRVATQKGTALLPELVGAALKAECAPELCSLGQTKFAPTENLQFLGVSSIGGDDRCVLPLSTRTTNLDLPRFPDVDLPLMNPANLVDLKNNTVEIVFEESPLCVKNETTEIQSLRDMFGLLSFNDALGELSRLSPQNQVRVMDYLDLNIGVRKQLDAILAEQS